MIDEMRDTNKLEGETDMDAADMSYYDLTKREREHLKAINQALTEIERRLHPAAVRLRHKLQARKEDHTDFLHDYELAITVEMYSADCSTALDEEESNNPITSLVKHLTNVNDAPKFGFGAHDTNHAEPGCFPGERHCWLYHAAYDHSGLSWRDLLRVGQVWGDLVITEQTRVLVAPAL